MIWTKEELLTKLKKCHSLGTLDEETLSIIEDLARRIHRTFRYAEKITAQKCFDAGLNNIEKNWKKALGKETLYFSYLCELYKRAAHREYAKINKYEK